jgi:HlyD family secretion protein
MTVLDMPCSRSIGMLAGALLLVCAGCGGSEAKCVQGYVEAEFIYVASQLSGPLENLYVERGAQVQAGDPLFALDDAPDKALRNQAARMLAQARANWTDLTKGKRPPEIASIGAQLMQAKAALIASDNELHRQETLLRRSNTSQADFDKARAQRDQDKERIAQLEADLETARLPARSDQIDAAAANVRALEAALAKSEWDLAQKRQAALQASLVFDTLFREGEWVPAGKPVVVLLPPPNIKVRAFVPETRIGAVKVGQEVRVFVDGIKDPFAGRVAFISPQAEYTPPVIYSQESRSKLVFMIEARFDPRIAAKLHPGQPVDVELGTAAP